VPIFLKVEDTDTDQELAVTLGGLKRAEFDDALARVRSIPGKRWNPDDKSWRFPADADTATRLVQTLAPVPDPQVEQLVRNHSAEVAGSLVTAIPDDAALAVPWHEKLYAFQRGAVDFMARNPHLILADDMGLGKTVEAISAAVEYHIRNPSAPEPVTLMPEPGLVVCPNMLTRNWQNELVQWTGIERDSIQIIDGKNKAQRDKQAARTDAQWFVVNWEKLRLMEQLADRKWGAVIADEAHRAKNKDAKQTKALYKLTAPVQIAATGTPIMNNPAELWSLLRWLYPEVYGPKVKGGGYWPFYYRFVEDYPTQYGRVIIGVKNADALRFELKDKLVRRTKEDQLDLPPKVRKVQQVDLNPQQRKLYEEAEKQLVLDIAEHIQGQIEGREDVEQYVRDAAEALASNPEKAQYVLPNGAARITRLRQIASSPALLGGPDDSAKLDAVVELVKDHPGKPFVVFTWFQETVRLLEKRLRKLKPAVRVGTIAGSDDAAPVVKLFQDGDLDIVVCTIAKGGVGLTMTRADTAIFVERDWVPAINEQAEDRLHRIGQDSHVTIITLEAADTVDGEKVARANRLKSAIVTSILGGTE
jgi:SNF2 family DNA or RNA helicase